MSQADRVVVICNLQTGTYVGSPGLIGRELVSFLCGRVASLTVAGSPVSNAFRMNGVRYVDADPMDPECMSKVIKGATVVYQLTAEKDIVLGARNVASACLEHHVRRMIFNSTCDALYLGRKGRIDGTAGPDAKPELRNPYARGKIAAETLLLECRTYNGLPVVIMRPGIIVGPGVPLMAGGIGYWMAPTCLLGWGTGRNPMPFVLAHDAASGFLQAMDAPGIEGKAFNIVGDVFLSTCEYIDLLREHTLRNFRFYPRNLLWLTTKITLKAVLKRILGQASQRQYRRDIMSSAMLTEIDNGAAKQLLRWQPNADLDVFIRKAISSNMPALRPGELRLSSSAHSCRSSS